MKRYILLAISLCMMLASGLSAEDGNEKPVMYQMMWQSDNVKGTVYINGFEITTLKGMTGSGTASLNLWLIGKNEIRADVLKADKTKESSFALGVSKLAPGDMVDTAERGNLLSVEKKDADFAGGAAVNVSMKFKSDIDFSGNLAGWQNVDDRTITDYAAKIYRLFAKKDVTGIMGEFAVKIEDYSKAFGGADMAAEFESMLKNEILKGRLEKVNVAKLKVVRTGPGGFIWHVVEGGRELIRMKNADGSMSEMPVYIGMVKGALKVVR